MSVNKFGLSENVSDSEVTKTYIDSQFITLVRRLEKKANKNGETFSGAIDMVDNKITSTFKPDTPDTLVNKFYVDDTMVNKSGDVMTGNLDMNNNRITNVKHPPESNADVITKEYCDSFGEHLRVDILKEVEQHVVANDIALQNNIEEKLSVNGGSMNGDINMGHNVIFNVGFPSASLDVVNKKYLQVANMNDNVDLKKLMSICRPLNDLLLSETFTSKYDREFRLKYTWMQNLILRYNKLYNSEEIHPDVEGILSGYVNHLKCLLLTIIEELPRNLFTDLKAYLVRAKLIVGGKPIIPLNRPGIEITADYHPFANSRNLHLIREHSQVDHPSSHWDDNTPTRGRI